MNVTKLIHIHSAEVAISTDPVVFSTILGSCVSVCLFSPRTQVGGMNHFALPSEHYAHSTNTGDTSKQLLRFGKESVATLIEEMCLTSNISPEELNAKVVGGASVVDELKLSTEIGKLNIAMAEQILRSYRIPIIGRDVGGESGRKVLFYSHSGRLRVASLSDQKEQAQSQTHPKEFTSFSKPSRKTRVLIVDDSNTICKLLTHLLMEDSSLEVVGSAPNPIEAEPFIRQLKPDVLTLDINMPKMDGITFLEKLLSKTPLPVVMITSLNMTESKAVLRALELGAVDYIQKPSFGELKELAPVICEKIKTAASVKVKRRKLTTFSPLKLKSQRSHNLSCLVAIGASTGGTEALKELLIQLPKEIPPILIVQHIPPLFSAAFANRLNELCSFEVKEAKDGDLVLASRVLIAPGDFHMSVKRTQSGYKVILDKNSPVHRHRPSVDVLFTSVSENAQTNSIGILLTGMGTDGAKGLLRMRQAGARTIAQDESSCVVFGMPKEAIRLGAVETILPLDRIPSYLMDQLSRKRSA